MEREERKHPDDLTEIPEVSELNDFKKELRYTPLSLVNLDPYDTKNTDYEMREHAGNADDDWVEFNINANDITIDPESLIGYGIHKRRPKLLICITMYNEPAKQLVESLAGIYRSYYELSKLFLSL